jgi:hypothetical protein
VVGQSDSIVLGAITGVNSAITNTNVGIGTTTPRSGLEVKPNWDGAFGAIAVAGDRPTVRFSSDSAVAANQQWLLHVGSATGSVPSGGLSFFNGGTGGTSFGSTVFAVTPSNTVVVGSPGGAGAATLCRNAFNEISACFQACATKRISSDSPPGWHSSANSGPSRSSGRRTICTTWASVRRRSPQSTRDSSLTTTRAKSRALSTIGSGRARQRRQRTATDH